MHHSGYTGRRAAFEILMLNGRLRRLISEGANEEQLTEEAVSALNGFPQPDFLIWLARELASRRK